MQNLIHKLQKYSIFIVSILFILFSLKSYHAYKDDGSKITEDYTKGFAVNLDRNVNAKQIKDVLLQRGYFFDESDATLVAHIMADSLHSGRKLSSLYDLKMRGWKIPIDVVLEQGGEHLKASATKSYNSVCVYTVSETKCQSTVNLSSGDGRITVNVTDGDTAAIGVTVLLRHHYFNESRIPQDSVVAVAVTSEKGEVCFEGLDMSASYSVLPVRKGFEYGHSRGTSGGTLGQTQRTPIGWRERIQSLFSKTYGDLQFSFKQRQLRIPMFDDATLRSIRNDHAFTLRTPDQYKRDLTRYVTLFILIWLFLCGVMWLRRRKETVFWPVAVLMGITGIGLLGMLSFNDPFTDKVLARDYLIGIGIGVAIMALIQRVDFKRLYSSRWFNFIGDHIGHKGWGWFFLALLMTLLLFTPLGHSVGGMTVNLKLGPLVFQPSEIVKYLIVFFFSAWFCRKSDSLVGYSEAGNINLTWAKLIHVFGIFIALFGMLVVYLLLGDMGPGLVLLFSFIIIYSIVKSRPKPESGGFIERALNSDVFFLIVGVVSFLFLIWVGSLLYLSAVFAGIWFVGWLFIWYFTKRQLVESPIMANMVISAFVFAKNLPGAIGERFITRSEMCSNTWGNLGLNGTEMRATTNSQVAEGLWGLASGGFWGQGLGNGSSNYIPAFHTDMVLSSLGEQIGWLGLVVVTLLLLALLHHSVAVGYRSRHKFLFFLCLGIAVVTAVQFSIISLGGTGIIPLTGVAVPLLSYGRVSLIMTLMAFGIVLSVEAHISIPIEGNNADEASANLFHPYDAPIALTRAAWFFLIIFILCVFVRPMLFNRNATLVRPLFVTSQSGLNIIQYNPRISDVERAMSPGNIYDRNGLLLATSVADSVRIHNYAKCGVFSDELNKVLSLHTRRYYPLGDRLLFMIGNLNNAAFLNYYEGLPIGYLAESQYMSYLRGFDNILYSDKDKSKPCKVSLVSHQYKCDRYQPAIENVDNGVVVRDYSVLLPILKSSHKKERIEKVNAHKSKYIKPQDLYLTIDATLQCRLQDCIADYVNKNIPYYSNKRLLRVSVVVLDAKDGDLLASALYPLPNKDTLLNHFGEKYNDGSFSKNQPAWTDRDIGLTFFTEPGSTAKVMTAMAGLRKVGHRAAEQKFFINPAEQIDVGVEDCGYVSMRQAIVMSSNCYFINLMNHFNLYHALDSIYTVTGARLGEEKYGKTSRLITPYYLHYSTMHGATYELWKDIVNKQEIDGIAHYQSYILHRKQHPQKMNYRAWQWAWGQGSLSTTPLSMARVVSALANGGVMPKTRYRLDEPCDDGIRLVSNESAELLKGYMNEMARTANGNVNNSIKLAYVGGKTGTPQRVLTGKRKPNDGWFIFYVDGCFVRAGNKKTTHPLAVAVRIERLADSGMGSGVAMRLSRDAIIPILQDLGYHTK